MRSGKCDSYDIEDICSKLLSERIIFLNEELNDKLSNLIVAQLLYLESQEPKKDIQLYINSPGASITAGFAVYDTMKYIQCDVSTICIGLAAGLSALLLSGGTKGKRMALPNAEIMIHQPAVNGGGISGQASDIKILSEHMQRNKMQINRIFSDNTGKSLEEITNDTERYKYMNAWESLEYGLIDNIIH